ncbi:unnamed protein product [Didymodactylos carnosus]|uniref:Uncharacterized protein n=1 Tax=Didymodactylos carnosus TaxID=1234261 RepID=A0A8S2PP27_9BILA|nr:unnamed protein product [Didymodactylos carnosus]CAF4064592.1 unnamed protein product [Didymodactylos carnosus]
MLSSNYRFCSLCAKPQPNYTFRKLFKHIRYFHLGEPNFKVRRELGPTCRATYSTFGAYKTHIYREHSLPLDEQQSSQLISLSAQDHDDDASYDTQPCYDIEMGDRQEEKEEEDKEKEERNNENNISWPLFTRKINWRSDSQVNLDNF